jgi:hypothetical protein
MQDDWSCSARSLDEDFGLAPPVLLRPRPGYLVCSTAWLTRILPVVRTPDQLVVALLLYRQCLRKRSRTVAFSNGDLAELGISRQTKYRALNYLQEAGAIALTAAKNARSIEVTLHWFP